MGFLENGGKDIDGIMKALENSNAFSALAGMSAALLPVLFIMYGSPVRGITTFTQKLQAEGADIDTNDAPGGEPFVEKLKHLQKQAPSDYEKFRLETLTLTGNVAAGSDTTSISLTGALYHALTTDGVTERMYDELDSRGFCSSARQHITFEQAQQLPYLQMVIKEALRIHPAVGLPMWREVVGPGLDVGETHLPPGVSLWQSLMRWNMLTNSTRQSWASILGLHTEMPAFSAQILLTSSQEGGIHNVHPLKSWRRWVNTTYLLGPARGLA